MAEVSIDIDAMATLVSSLGSARTDLTGASGSLKGNLSTVWLSTAPLGHVDALDAHLASALRDLNRRLALARMIAQSTPGMTVVSFDDSVLATADDAEIQRRVNRVLELMKVEDKDFGQGRDVDPELLDLLAENSLDPYFAQALAKELDPETLRRFLYSVNQQRTRTYDPDEIVAFDAKYDALLSGLGESLGLASRGTGDLEVPGMTKAWTSYIEEFGTYRGIGAVNLLSLVIERGHWSDDFITGVYRSVREVEGDSGTDQWAVGGIDMVIDPVPDRSPGARIASDPMYGIMRALASSPGAMARLFTGGETTTVTVDGREVEVDAELYAFIRHRGALDEETVNAFMDAISSAVASAPVEGSKAFQPLLADDIRNIGEALQDEAEKAAEEAGPWWKQIGHGLLDLAGMVPVIGEPADFVNGVWYYADGDVINGSLSMGALIPFVGWASTGGKWTKRLLSAQDIAKLNRLAREGDNIRIFAKDGKILSRADLTLPESFRPDRFLSPAELTRWSGDRAYMRNLIAGNRFNYFLNPRYAYREIPLTTGNKAPFRLDSYTPREAIVSRKLSQLGEVNLSTAKGYIDEFATKYPAGTRIADTPMTRELGINGQRLRGPMILEVPPQAGGVLPSEIVRYAESKNIFIRDLNGTFYTKAPS